MSVLVWAISSGLPPRLSGTPATSPALLNASQMSKAESVLELPPARASVHGLNSTKIGYYPAWGSVDHEHAFG
jgi:hypothetical protein